MGFTEKLLYLRTSCLAQCHLPFCSLTSPSGPLACPHHPSIRSSSLPFYCPCMIETWCTCLSVCSKDFFPLCGLSLHSLDYFFFCAGAFYLDVNFIFPILAIDVLSKKLLTMLIFWSIFLIFSSSSFMLSCLISRSFMYLGLIFAQVGNK